MNSHKFTVSELQKKVDQAVKVFKKHDKEDLIDKPAHEQAISHRIAYYLENQFPKRECLNIDCEYDRHFEDHKEFNFEKEYEECDCGGCKNSPDNKSDPEKRFRPDVLVHSRRNDDCNLIAIEIKQLRFCLFDEAKLKALTKPKTPEAGGKYGYTLGVFLYFPKDGFGVRVPKIEWFIDGERITASEKVSTPIVVE
jgi:hypothetical protein